MSSTEESFESAVEEVSNAEKMSRPKRKSVNKKVPSADEEECAKNKEISKSDTNTSDNSDKINRHKTDKLSNYEQLQFTNNENKLSNTEETSSDKSTVKDLCEFDAIECNAVAAVQYNISNEDIVLQPLNSSAPKTPVTTQPHTEQFKKDSAEPKPKSGWGTWSTWGASFMSAASSSVSTFTSQVEEGWNTVLETVESSLGVPDPEDLAEKKAEERGISTSKDDSPTEPSEETTKTGDGDDDTEKGKKAGSGFWASLGVHEFDELTSMVADKSKVLVSGGLDILETIGKKTYDVVVQHDPGLQKTRSALSSHRDKPNLSALLREAKESANERVESDKEYDESLKSNFSAMFDEFQGLSHLEALEILSSQSERKVQILLASMDDETRDEASGLLDRVKDEFELDDESEDENDVEVKDHHFSELISENLSLLQLNSVQDKLTAVQSKIRQWLDEFCVTDTNGDYASLAKEVHREAIQSLAKLTSSSMEQFHKTTELVLLQRSSADVTVEQARALAGISRVLCTEVSILSTRFSGCLNAVASESEDSDLIHPLMTIVYLEASNSSTYIHDAFQLILPALQQAVLERLAS